MPVMLLTSYFFLAGLSLWTTHLLMYIWISELPEAFTCFIDPPWITPTTVKQIFLARKSMTLN